MAELSRHYVTVGDRQVHYYRTGSGPALLLLHGSPESGASLSGVMDLMADRFTCIAPDTPGNGLSDGLTPDEYSGEWATLADYGDALVKLLDALEIERAAFYGFHTGAAITLAAANRHPDRFTGIVANGYPSWTEAESRDMVANYLPVWQPQWDGSHMAWLWSRLWEQVVFFPWYTKSPDDRMALTMSSVEKRHDGSMEMLRAGDAHRMPYRAALGSVGTPSLKGLKVPTLITAFEGDPLHDHYTRFPAFPDHIRWQSAGSDPAAGLAMMKDTLLGFEAGSVPGAPPSPGTRETGFGIYDYVDGEGLRLRLLRGGSGGGLPAVILHGAGAASGQSLPLMQALGENHPVLAIDLPGHGESDPAAAGEDTLSHAAMAVLAALDALGIGEAELIARDEAAALGVMLAERKPATFKHLALLGAEDNSGNDLAADHWPDLSPRWDGGHLLSAWHYARMKALFHPWNEQTADNAVPDAYGPTPERQHEEAVDLLKAADSFAAYGAAAADFPLTERLKALNLPRLVISVTGTPLAGSSIRLAEAAGIPGQSIADDPAAIGDSLEAFFKA